MRTNHAENKTARERIVIRRIASTCRQLVDRKIEGESLGQSRANLDAQPRPNREPSDM